MQAMESPRTNRLTAETARVKERYERWLGEVAMSVGQVGRVRTL
jgi:hypothetical protein